MEIAIATAVIGALAVVLGVFVQYFTSKWRSDEDRKESFKLKLFEHKIDAAQIAYKYVFQVYRAYARNRTNTSRADKLSKEARDWLNGQVLILGEDIHKAVFSYFNSAHENTSKTYDLMEEATRKLKKVVKNKLLD